MDPVIVQLQAEKAVVDLRKLLPPAHLQHLGMTMNLAQKRLVYEIQ
jgi:hypothetical protein